MASRRCKVCGGPIRWVARPGGKKIALEPSPDPNGTWELVKEFDVTVGKVVVVAKPLTQPEIGMAKAAGKFLWVPHVAWCHDPSTPRPIPSEIPPGIRARVESYRAARSATGGHRHG